MNDSWRSDQAKHRRPPNSTHPNSSKIHCQQQLLFLSVLLITFSCRFYTESSPATVVQPTPAPTTQSISPAIEIKPTLSHLEENRESQTSQWATRSWLDPEGYEEIATGAPDMGVDCKDGYLAGLPEPDQEIKLTLSYPTAVLPQQINLYGIDLQNVILRIEMLNYATGLADPVFHTGNVLEAQPFANHVCELVYPIQVESDFEVDTLIITFANQAASTQLDAVELVGQIPYYRDLPLFWRVRLPDTPISMAINEEGSIYVASEPNEISTYDLEGNLQNQYFISTDTNISDISIDNTGNLIVLDNTFDRFFVISPSGEHLLVVEDQPGFEVAVNPVDNTINILSELDYEIVLRTFQSGTGELLHETPLEYASYTGLELNTQGQPFTVLYWENILLNLNPVAGAEQDAIPLFFSERAERSVRDFTLDENGNFYVLFNSNDGNIAVHQVDSKGNLLLRFGLLNFTADGEWPESSFFDPYAISVTADGRFVIIADGYGDTAYLSAYQMEID
jgi:hypothetical protein